MELVIYSSLPALALLIFFVPGRVRVVVAGLATLAAGVFTSVPALSVLSGLSDACLAYQVPWFPGSPAFVFDPLSSFFVLAINLTVASGVLFSHGYLHADTASGKQTALHYFSLVLLHYSMLGVVLLREGTAFLVAWELMAVSSFLLILYEAGRREVLKTAVRYMIQMHIGFFLLVAAFLIAGRDTGTFGFDSLPAYFGRNPNLPLFLLFFAGFAIKAGFIPFHTWLPEAHPAAPSHVSAVMSGIMVKMGIYGIARVAASCTGDLITIGAVVALFGLLSALYGILSAAFRKDLKEVLAYSTIENVGIIGLGLGTGLVGAGAGQPAMAFLGFGAALFHIANHSLYKPLLFMAAGSVYKATHTRNIEQLGGLVRSLPRTAALFMTGAMAICGLPPLSGFISEVMLFGSMFEGIRAGNVWLSVAMVLAAVGLAVVAGLSVFVFTRAFGITFLGLPRSEIRPEPGAVTRTMMFPKLVLASLILLAGLFPAAAWSVVAPAAATLAGQPGAGQPLPLMPMFSAIGRAGMVLILAVTTIMVVRRMVLGRRTVNTAPTWGCGYTAGTARLQYTGESFTGNLGELAAPLLHEKTSYMEIREEEIFPEPRSFQKTISDPFRLAIGRAADWSALALKRLARLQTGYIQHYVLYAFLFMLAIFILMTFKLI